MADSSEVMTKIMREPGVNYPVLTPNLKGLEKAISVGVKEVAIFAAASEKFSQANINCSIKDSLSRYREVVGCADLAGIPVRGYIFISAVY